MQKIVSPSLLSADFLNLGRDAELLNRSAAEWFHLDVMDGAFVPNISYGIPVVEALRRATTKVLDVHLMIERPERFVADFRRAGADFITFHIEATPHAHRTLQMIKAEGARAGVALCPSTSLSTVEELLDDAQMILLMSVNPGFGGQQFIEATYSKIERLRAMGYKGIIQVDGGVNAQNAAKLYAAGAHCLVAGSAVFKAEDPEAMIAQILNA